MVTVSRKTHLPFSVITGKEKWEMPGNIIQFNGSKAHEWYVGDSKMDSLIAYLDEIGFRTKEIPEGENLPRVAEDRRCIMR